MHTQTISSIQRALAARDYSSTELCQHYLDRIDAANPVLNAFITVIPEAARAGAAAAE